MHTEVIVLLTEQVLYASTVLAAEDKAVSKRDTSSLSS